MCLSPCSSCAGDIDQCTSCLQTVEDRYFFRGRCRARCPKNISVYVRDDGMCSACSDNCKTCSGQPSLCASCRGPMKLDMLDSSCKETCPSGTTVDMGKTCEPCHSTCATCSDTDVDYCLTCQPGLKFNPQDNTCMTQCPTGTAQVNEYSGVERCEICAEGCLECAGSPDYCNKCDDSLGYLFYKFACVPDQCPADFKRLSDDQNVCVPENEACKFGYAYNANGECDLEAVACEEGNLLNLVLKTCIPQPGLQLPFLFLAAAGLWSVYVHQSSAANDDTESTVSQ